MRPIYNKSLDLDKVIVILCERLMLKKYVRIMEWDVPDIDDEKQARGLVMQALKSALAEVEANQE